MQSIEPDIRLGAVSGSQPAFVDAVRRVQLENAAFYNKKKKKIYVIFDKMAKIVTTNHCFKVSTDVKQIMCLLALEYSVSLSLKNFENFNYHRNNNTFFDLVFCHYQSKVLARKQSVSYNVSNYQN